MAHMVLKGSLGKIIINLEVESNSVQDSFFGSYLLTETLVELIEEADLHGWEKSNADREGAEIDASQFFAAILAAVARSYNYDLAEPQDDVAPYDLLKRLIEDLHSAGNL